MTPRSPELGALGARIRRLRRRLDISQETLAARADLSPKHVSELERGNKDPRYSSMVRIAQGLEVGMAELAGERQPQPIREAAA